ncbi:MAG TPA: hypothetical protein VH912_00055 [Streptosporangiaceae bacterium]|jgi:hypothetical protein
MSTLPRATAQRSRYAYLLGIYLGDGTLSVTTKGVYRLEIACSDEWPGFMDLAGKAISAAMPQLSVGRRAQPGCTVVNAYSKHWPRLFPQHGPGMKHKRKIGLTQWQQKIVNRFTRSSFEI